jgi:NADPH-dependent glutamate synthase beta subunit-like oxidoreductase/ferredoxin
VVGAGPAGLSFAYQMARRGYPVTIYERQEAPGGMLRYGIPEYRLPERVLQGEVDRILALGVKLQTGVGVGREVTVEELSAHHAALFLGVGAQAGKRLGIPGEDGPGVFTGTVFLGQVHRAAPPGIGERVLVVGGGDTAIDSARVARRLGAAVTIVYRRAMEEMPANHAELRAAQLEGIEVECFVSPVEIRRSDGRVRAAVLQRMQPGPVDPDGRRRPLPVAGSEFERPADTIIVAIAQTPDWNGLDGIVADGAWARPDVAGHLNDRWWAGGDIEGPGIASLAVARGRHAAEALHAQLRGLPDPDCESAAPVGVGPVKPDYFLGRRRAAAHERPPEEWLTHPDDEIDLGLNEHEFLDEAGRCLSCGSCIGCEQCWMYCSHNCFTRLEEVRPGAYFGLTLDNCQACGKCIDVCPCGFLEPRLPGDHAAV